ncbi:MAG: bifunctional (p)ppGpp synthetase/guanosine-3',5'-bis(diphosphate) 3'-pyrophosphohydrolase [Alphaproteobacteria bacterium]|nr:bifunctional (p)ppGpp synthetase/guanosine-3',5'-bis(diphosphate) 3'-pyrophosphohydrolase [Alphaproteobacteria bacterium]
MTELNVKPLTDRIRAYNPAIDDDLLSRAFSFAEKAHSGQVRASGEPYFTHPIEVAHILADMHVDPATIITALLHDVVEDTEVSLESIRSQFTDEIARLVDGVTKLTRIEMQSDNRQAENFRKLVLAMSEDIRVLLVKLADRTHNMRTIDHIAKPEKRERIAQETLMIFAPLAERIGMTHFQHELEDRAFAVLNHQMRNSILQRLEFLAEQSEDLVSRICDEMGVTLFEADIESSVSGRRKSPYSIWQKMQREKVEMEELSDIMAFRVIVPEVSDCYRALGILHQSYPMVMGRFKDYISTPKRNGYQSLHTGIIGPNKKKIEVQIRTPEMHEVAERGVAAHWNYNTDGKPVNATEHSKLKWLNDLVNILENTVSPDEFLEHTQMEMYADQVFCFTPKGSLIPLPKGATAVDFAYAVHSDVGNSCIGVKINGRIRQLATLLKNGDQIEVLRSSTATPNPEWLDFCKTGRAKAQIRRFMRAERQQEFAEVGRALVLKAFRAADKTFDEKDLLPVLAHYDTGSDIELFALVGEGQVDARDVLTLIHPELKKTLKPDAKTSSKSTQQSTTPSLNIKGLTPGMAVHHGRCCSPLPGERIIGIVTHGKGITVHRVDCQNLEKFSTMPELWLDIEWEGDSPNIVSARLEAVIANERGSLATVTTLISEHGGNITNIQLVTRTLDFFTFVTDVEVKDVRHLTAIVAAMQSSPFIESVERAKS